MTDYVGIKISISSLLNTTNDLKKGWAEIVRKIA